MRLELTLGERVPCSTILYRAILKPSYINKADNDVEVLPGAFRRQVLIGAFRLKEKDGAAKEEDLSVHVAELDLTGEQYAVRCGLDLAGVASLHAGRVRDIRPDESYVGDVQIQNTQLLDRRLEVIFDEEEDGLRHCKITGIPMWQAHVDDDEEFLIAEHFADQLSEQARLDWQKPKKK